MVIDSDDRGLFKQGTVVTANGGSAVKSEEVDQGSHRLTINHHWETLGRGANAQGYGSTTSAVVEAKDCDD